MKIKHKLWGLSIFSLVALVAVVLITEVANLKLLKMEKTLIEAKSLEVSLLSLNTYELEFLHTHDQSLTEKFAKEAKHFDAALKIFKADLESLNIPTDKFSTLQEEIRLYKKDFAGLVEGFKATGENDEKLVSEMKHLFNDILSIFVTFDETLEHEVEVSQDSIATTIVLSILFVAVVLVGLSYVVSSQINRKISQLNSVMTSVAKANDLTLRADATGNDELGDMASRFNALLTQIQGLVQSTQNTIIELNGTSQDLKTGSISTQEAITQQQLETDSVATAMTEMRETIREVAITTELAANNTQKSYEVAQSGLQHIVQTRDTITDLSSELTAASNEVDSLSALSEQISSVLDVIKGIAEQTNLLALNAAIEAARAGEQGRGFAVVADEVRTLAGRTQNSTEEISNIITSVQEQTKTVVTTITKCTDSGQQSVLGADEAHEKIQTMMEDLQNILDSSTQIATAVEEQSAVSEEMSRNINNISNISNENVEAVATNTASSEQIAVQADELAHSISTFKA